MKKFNFNNAHFLTSAISLETCPKPFLPEIAVIGRSNVGKSSLLNDLFQKKGLAKTSSTPGKTRMINYFSIDDQLYFVDLPGYGYAKAKGVDFDWEKMIETYLKERETLRLLLLLIDIRRGLIKEDLQMYEWIVYHRIPIVLVLTKVDKVKSNERAQSTKEILGTMNAPHVHYSVTKNEGRKELIQRIYEIIT